MEDKGKSLGFINATLYENGTAIKSSCSTVGRALILSRIVTALLKCGMSEDTIDLAVSAGKDDFFDSDDYDNDLNDGDDADKPDSENETGAPDTAKRDPYWNSAHEGESEMVKCARRAQEACEKKNSCCDGRCQY